MLLFLLLLLAVCLGVDTGDQEFGEDWSRDPMPRGQRV